MENLQLIVQELSFEDQINIDGGILPAVMVWLAGATTLTKIGVIGGATAIIGRAAFLGYNNGHDSVKK